MEGRSRRPAGRFFNAFRDRVPSAGNTLARTIVAAQRAPHHFSRQRHLRMLCRADLARVGQGIDHGVHQSPCCAYGAELAHAIAAQAVGRAGML